MSSAKAKRKYYETNYQELRERNRRKRAVYRNLDRQHKRTSHLRKRYGITQGDYDAMFRAQGGACAICRTTESNNGKDSEWFDVDHDHSTKQVRGLLCRHCNVLLGHLEKDQALLDAAMAYLAVHRARVIQPRPEPQKTLPFHKNHLEHDRK